MNYFDTSKRLVAAHLTDPSQCSEVVGFCNTFTPHVYTRLHELPAYLKANNGRMLPMIDLAILLFDRSTGVLADDWQDTLECLMHTVKAHHKGRALFWWNEIMFQHRLASFSGKPRAEAEVIGRYVTLKQQAREIGEEIRLQIPGSGLIQIESYVELTQQWHTWGALELLDDCEYLAFDAYGPIDNVGGRSQQDFFVWLWEARQRLEAFKKLDRKLFFVPGAFTDKFTFTDEDSCLAQLKHYFSVFDQWSDVGAIGIFTWGTVVEPPNVIVGARHLSHMQNWLLPEMFRHKQRAGKVVP